MFSIANFPAVCIEDIFRHFTFKELLQCTLVCSEWNEFIGSTRSCMKKIKFIIKPNRLGSSEVTLETLTNSERKYECLEVAGEYSVSMKNCLMAEGRRWTRICLHDLKFKTVEHFLDFLMTFESSVQVLLLGNVKIIASLVAHVPTLDLQFP